MQYFAPVSLYIKANTLMTASKITVIAIIKSIEVKYKYSHYVRKGEKIMEVVILTIVPVSHQGIVRQIIL